MTTVLNDRAPQAALARTTAHRKCASRCLVSARWERRSPKSRRHTRIPVAALRSPPPWSATCGARAGSMSPDSALPAIPFSLSRPDPDVVIEVLGGLEPARTLVLAALDARLPVVTANKSLLAVHGDDLFARLPGRASPLLLRGQRAGRGPLPRHFRGGGRWRGAASASRASSTAQATSSSRGWRGTAWNSPPRYPRPNAPVMRNRTHGKDLDGDDAVEKLCVLLRHFGDYSVAPSQIEQRGIRDVGDPDLQHAAAFGGAILPIAAAAWRDAQVTAYVGPAFVAGTHQLCRSGRRAERGVAARCEATGCSSAVRAPARR